MEFSTLGTETAQLVLFMHQLVRTALPISGKVAVFEVIAIQTLVTASIRMLNNGQR